MCWYPWGYTKEAYEDDRRVVSGCLLKIFLILIFCYCITKGLDFIGELFHSSKS